MTERQQQALALARQRIAKVQPDVAIALLAAIRLIIQALPESELARLISSGAIDQVLVVMLADRVLARSTLPLRLALRDAVARPFRYNAPYLPHAGKIKGTIAVVFDQLNPRVVASLRSLDTRVVSGFTDEVRTTVRETIARGLLEKRADTAIARDVRSVIGLAPKDARAVANYRTLLESGDRAALTRALRDRRFDAAIEKAIGPDGTGLTPRQIDAITEAYRRNALADRAELVSRAATHDAYKIALRESWQAAIDVGLADAVTKEWFHLDAQPDPRPHHAAMQGETVAIDRNYSNGDSFAGEHDPWNCHCFDIYAVA